MAKQRTCCGWLWSPRFHGVLVGLMTLVNSISAITASVYLRLKFEDFQKVPENLSLYYRYATIDIIFVVIVLLVVSAYFIGIFTVNEYYTIPFIILLLLDFMGYVATQLATTMSSDTPELFRGKTMGTLSDIALYGYMFLTVFFLFRSLQRDRRMQEERLLGYRSLSSSSEQIMM
ncbi:AGAP007322-PA-like protein [Anopheles sinensis]|uniref:AGAP007322-PA-like protein n=1 Tax=Anopheles sinensis TaxID=74873 RepID=A0A084VQN3_ANOSI|nr:AGAP007322-PA-like protein [Anopheles sinensis]